MLLEKNDVVRIDNETFKVVCADDELAVLGRLFRNIDDPSIVETDYSALIAYANENEFEEELGDYEILFRGNELPEVDEDEEIAWICEKTDTPKVIVSGIISRHYDYLRMKGICPN